MTRKKSAKDYPPEFYEAWELASKGTLILALPTKGGAVNMRQRLYAFRKTFIEENGQAEFNHWFNYDLVVEGNTVQTGTLDWKKQVRTQAAKEGVPPLPQPKIENPSPLLPEGLGPTKSTKTELSSVPPSAKEAMDSALAKLGFTSGGDKS